MQLTGELGSQTADIARTQGEINGLNAAWIQLADRNIREPGANASDQDKAEMAKIRHQKQPSTGY